MEYRVHEMLSYKLHMIKTDKFKTTTMKIIFSEKITKQIITLKNLLSDLLIYSCKKYPTKRDLSIALQDLYAMNIFSDCYRIGNLYNSEIGITFLNEKYTEKGMFEKSISILSEIIFNPNILESEFDNSSFEIVKELNRNQIESVKEDTRKLSLIKMLECMGKKESYSLHGFGYLDDLNKITSSILYNYYFNFLKSNKIDIYIIGDIDFNKTIETVTNLFKFSEPKNTKFDISVYHEKFRKVPKKVINEMNILQSKLSIGCKIKDTNDFEKKYVLTLYSIILGGSSDSKFFRNIREKNSLCYYISSTANKMDNIILITSGINKNNFSKVVRLIKKEMKDMQDGKFTESEIEKAKANYITLLDELSDNPSQIISSYYSTELLNFDDIETRKKKILTVTKKDIENLSKKIIIDTIYLLGGNN